MVASLPSSPAALRNRQPIADVLREILVTSGTVLELASGTGEHVEYFARLFPRLDWQPSDIESEATDWIRARASAAGCANILDPLVIDVTQDSWPLDRADAILCANMIHISPWEATLGLMRGAGRLLAAGAPLILYGPYRRDDVPTAPSNEAFDQSLRSRNPAWGLRRLEDVRAAAEASGLGLERLVDMPANNLMLIFRRR